MSCNNQRDCAAQRECPTQCDLIDRREGCGCCEDWESCEGRESREGREGCKRRDCRERRECAAQQECAGLRDMDKGRDCDDAREKLLRRVQRYSFMTDDLRLYLNTHPDSQEALCALKRFLEMEREATQDYEQRYGPLTLEAMEERCRYDWIESPWPWEKEV